MYIKQHADVVGTRNGYKWHRRRGEEACEPCRAANVAHVMASYVPSPRKVVTHADVVGTKSGAPWHYNRGEKPCDPCREAKNAEALGKPYNRTRSRAACGRYREKHRDEINAKQRENARMGLLKYSHGMTPEQFAAWLAEHQGVCYLCLDPLPDGPRRTHIDHDHDHCPQGKSCEVCRRGPADHRCNLLIGLADDDPDRLELIAANLRAAQAAVAARIAAAPAQGALFEEKAPPARVLTGVGWPA